MIEYPAAVRTRVFPSAVTSVVGELVVDPTGGFAIMGWVL